MGDGEALFGEQPRRALVARLRRGKTQGEEAGNARHQPRLRPAGGAAFTHSLMRRRPAPSGMRIGGAGCKRPSVPG